MIYPSGFLPQWPGIKLGTVCLAFRDARWNVEVDLNAECLLQTLNVFGSYICFQAYKHKCWEVVSWRPERLLHPMHSKWMYGTDQTDW